MHKMNRLLVAVVSWYNFKLIWLHRFLAIKTIKRKIKLTPTGEVEKQGTQAVATPHNITINNKLNLRYLLNVFEFLRKKNIKFSTKWYFSLPLNTMEGRVDSLDWSPVAVGYFKEFESIWNTRRR